MSRRIATDNPLSDYDKVLLVYEIARERGLKSVKESNLPMILLLTNEMAKYEDSDDPRTFFSYGYNPFPSFHSEDPVRDLVHAGYLQDVSRKITGRVVVSFRKPTDIGGRTSRIVPSNEEIEAALTPKGQAYVEGLKHGKGAGFYNFMRNNSGYFLELDDDRLKSAFWEACVEIPSRIFNLTHL